MPSLSIDQSFNLELSSKWQLWSSPLCRVSVEHARGTRRAASRDRGRLVFKHTLSSVKRSGHLVFYGRLFVVRRFSRYRAGPFSKPRIVTQIFLLSNFSKQSVFYQNSNSFLKASTHCWEFFLQGFSGPLVGQVSAPDLFHSCQVPKLPLPLSSSTHEKMLALSFTFSLLKKIPTL